MCGSATILQQYFCKRWFKHILTNCHNINRGWHWGVRTDCLASVDWVGCSWKGNFDIYWSQSTNSFGSRWSNLLWSFTCRPYTNKKGSTVIKFFIPSQEKHCWVFLDRFQWLLKVLQQLYTLGFRLISHEVNMTVNKSISCLQKSAHTYLSFQVKNQSATKGYHAYLEVVLMRDTVWNFLDQNISWLLNPMIPYFHGFVSVCMCHG